jgi:hypothetical protein
MSTSFKFKFDNKVRRTAMGSMDGPSIASISSKISELFEIPSEDAISISYVDEDGDEVLVGSEEELKEGLSVLTAMKASTSAPFTFLVKIDGKEKETPVDSGREAEESKSNLDPSSRPYHPPHHGRHGRGHAAHGHPPHHGPPSHGHPGHPMAGMWRQCKPGFKKLMKGIAGAWPGPRRHGMRGPWGPRPDARGARTDVELSDEEIEQEILIDMMKTSVKDEDSKVTEVSLKKPMLRYVSDISLPDGTVVTPGDWVVKSWKVRNDGNQIWPSGTKIEQSGGDQTDIIVLPVPSPVHPLQEVELSVRIRAPEVPGRYVYYFRCTADDVPFGQRVWCDIKVSEPTTADRDCCGPHDVELELDLGQVAAGGLNDILEAGWNMVSEMQQQESNDNTAAPEKKRSTSDSASAAPAVVVPPNDWEDLWSAELKMLSAMGFATFGDMLPLLEEYLMVPSQLKDGDIDPEGVQKLINSLISLRNRNAEAEASGSENEA